MTFNANVFFGVENVQKYQVTSSRYQSGLRLTKMRTQPSNRANSDIEVYKSSAAPPESCMKPSQASKLLRTISRANRVLAKNIAGRGVTSVGLPTVVSSSAFLDSTIDNGYAFDDRYDMALSQNNKYGSLEDLLVFFVPSTKMVFKPL